MQRDTNKLRDKNKKHTDSIWHHLKLKNGTEPDAAAIERSIKSGADINERGTFNYTPFMFALENRFDHIVKLLLECGANPTLIAYEGQHALNYVTELSPIYELIKHSCEQHEIHNEKYNSHRLFKKETQIDSWRRASAAQPRNEMEGSAQNDNSAHHDGAASFAALREPTSQTMTVSQHEAARHRIMRGAARITAQKVRQNKLKERKGMTQPTRTAANQQLEGARNAQQGHIVRHAQVAHTAPHAPMQIDAEAPARPEAAHQDRAANQGSQQTLRRARLQASQRQAQHLAQQRQAQLRAARDAYERAARQGVVHHGPRHVVIGNHPQSIAQRRQAEQVAARRRQAVQQRARAAFAAHAAAAHAAHARMQGAHARAQAAHRANEPVESIREHTPG